MPKLNVEVAAKFRQALIDLGYTDPQLRMLMAQAAHETAGFNHKHAIENNNFAGIKFQKSLSKIAVPSTNYFAPRKEGGGSYAHFNSIADFVTRWIPYAHLNGERFENQLGAPLDAKDLKEYARRLKLNHYYQDTEENYLGGLTRWNGVLDNTAEFIDQNVKQQSRPVTPKIVPQDVLPPEFNHFKNWPLGNLLSEKHNVAEPKLVNISAAVRQNEALLKIQLAKPKEKVVDAIHNDPIARGNTNNLMPSLPDTSAMQLAMVDHPYGIDKNGYLAKSGHRSIDRLQTAANDLPLPTGILQGKEVNLSRQFSYLPNLWSAPKPYVVDNPLQSRSAASPLKLFDSIKAAEKLGDNSNYSPAKGSPQNRDLRFRMPYMEKNQHLGLPQEDWKLEKVDREHESPGGRENKEGYNNKSSTKTDHEAKVINVNLNSLIDSFTINTSSPASGVDDLKARVEQVLLEVVDNANSIQ